MSLDKFTFNYYSSLLNCQNNIPSNAVNAYKGVAGTCLTTNPLVNPNSNFLNGNNGFFKIGLYQSPCFANLNSGGDDDSLSGGAIAGIVIGVVAFCVLFAALIYYFYASKSAASGAAGNGIEIKNSTPNPVNS